MRTDMGVMEALAAYMKLGLHPGSFGYAILIQDKNLAYRTCHQLLLPEHSSSGEDIVANMLEVVHQAVPDISKGSKEKVEAWMVHKGLKGYGNFDMELVELKLKGFINWWDDTLYDYAS